MPTESNETELILLISKGDREAFSILYSKYLKNIYRYIFSICYDKGISEEITQELFIKIWEGRNNLINVIAIKPFLYKSAKNLLFNYIKKEATRARLIVLYHEEIPHTDDSLSAQVQLNDYVKISRDAIELLPEKRKQIFKLRSDDQLTIDEIALRLSISKSVVKKQWQKGALFVRKYLYKHGEIIMLFYSIILLHH